MTSEAQKKAQKKYDEKKNSIFRCYSLKLNRKEDADIIDKFDTEGIQAYIKRLVREDLKSCGPADTSKGEENESNG